MRYLCPCGFCCSSSPGTNANFTPLLIKLIKSIAFNVYTSMQTSNVDAAGDKETIRKIHNFFSSWKHK